MYMYISCWAMHGGAPGLALYEFDKRNGAMRFIKMVNTDDSFNNTFLDIKRNLLYAVNEVPNLKGVPTGGGGSVFVYKINPETADIDLICEKPTFSANPTYLTLDKEGKFLLVANHSTNEVVTKTVLGSDGKWTYKTIYDDATVVLFPVNEDGTLEDVVDVSFHVYNGPTRKLSHSHPHCTVMSPNGELFAVCDKGAATISMYKIDGEKKKLVLSAVYDDIPFCMPRYSAFHPSKPFFFINHETSRNFDNPKEDWKLDVCSFKYDKDGNLTPISRVSALPEGWVKPAEKHYQQQGFSITPDGKYLYTALMGPDAVSAFEINQTTGALRLIQFLEIGKDWPRGCMVSPDGKFLIITCLTTGDIFSYSIGPDGKLTSTGYRAHVAGSSYVTFYEPR